MMDSRSRWEPKSNWEKSYPLLLRTGRLHFPNLASLCLITIVFTFVILMLHERWVLSKVVNAFKKAAHTHRHTYGGDADTKELQDIVRRLLDGRLVVEDTRALLRLVDPQPECACGDFYDVQLERCFMMDPGIVLWFGGYSQGMGQFISGLATRLQGRVYPDAMYKNANCLNSPGPVRSLSQYSYSLSEVAVMRAIYATCEFPSNQVLKCLRHTGSGLKVSDGSEIKLSSSNAERKNPPEAKRLCDGADWCIRSVTPQRIMQNIAVLDSFQGAVAEQEVGTTESKERLMVDFLSFQPEDVQKILQEGESPQSCSVRLGSDEVGGWNETLAYFRYLWRCNIRFAVVRYGDGELAVMNGRDYSSETDLGNWSFKPHGAESGYLELVDLMMDGFKLAAEHSHGRQAHGGIFLGLPFPFCAEGFRDMQMGGGGHYDWLMEFLARFARILHSVDSHRLVYSWQWGHFNYPSAMEFVNEMGASSGGIILICNEEVLRNRRNLPQWVKLVLMVPGDGVRWISSDKNIKLIKKQAVRVARTAQNQVFIFSAGPISNALIPLMFRINSNNTYLDFGGALDHSVYGVKTRPFHPDANSFSKPWLRADGSLVREQDCHQTRWSVVYEPRVVPLDAPY